MWYANTYIPSLRHLYSTAGYPAGAHNGLQTPDGPGHLMSI